MQKDAVELKDENIVGWLFTNHGTVCSGCSPDYNYKGEKATGVIWHVSDEQNDEEPLQCWICKKEIVFSGIGSI